MKPAPFEYRDPSTVEEALAVLAEYGDDAKILAGGQSLVPLLNMRLARPQVLVDVNRLTTLSYIEEDADGVLRIGALTRQAALERSEVVARRCPLLREGVRLVGHAAIRSRGTVGGSIAHADPAAEIAGVAAALEATLVIRGPEGERVVGLDEFFLGYLMTTLDPTEMVVEVRFPTLPDGAGYAFLEVARRHGDFALVGVAAALDVGEDGNIAMARLGLIGVGPAAQRAPEAEVLLVGQKPTEDAFKAAGAAVSAAVDPDSDLHASADYRRDVAGVLTRRALAKALERCRRP